MYIGNGKKWENLGIPIFPIFSWPAEELIWKEMGKNGKIWEFPFFPFSPGMEGNGKKWENLGIPIFSHFNFKGQVCFIIIIISSIITIYDYIILYIYIWGV